MKRLLAALFALLWLAPALAQVSPIIVGTNIGGDPTITAGFPYATGAVPYQTNFVRVYDSIRGATAHATWWSTLNPTAGTYTFTANLDPILNTLASRNQASEYTLSGVPSYVNASQKVVGSTQLAQFSTFWTAMMTHIAANHRCFGYVSTGNEVNQPSAFWTGTAADMAALSAVAYPITKAICPQTIVLSASTTSGVDTGSSPNPNGPFQYLNAYFAACATGCFDVANVHGYPQVPSLQTANTNIFYAPELLANTITNAQAVAVANGFSSSIYLDEGYACSDPASTTIPANTFAYAGCQGTQLVIAAFAGVKSYANSFFGAGCANQTACGNEYRAGGPLKLTTWGLAKRNMVAWFSGATVATPFARTVGTNLITVAPNAASVATGSLGGTGTGCTSPPAGTGSLPVGASPWGLSATASIAGGMSYYVVGTAATPSIDVRTCGTDSSGANSDSIRMNNFTGAATQGQNVVIAACLGLAAGTLNGIQEIDLQINEYTSVPAYANEFMVQSQILPVSTTTVPITSQCFQTRYTMKAATAAFAVPYVLIKHYGSIAIDATFRIGAPRLDVNATRWSGTLTKAAGYTATIAEDASGSGSITAPAGTVDWRDIFGNVHKASSGNTIPLTGSPILIESIAQKAWLPGTVNAFVVAPTMGGNDSHTGTVASPFATLGKCHTAMQASSTIKTCYVRGVVTTASWVIASNEHYYLYPGDPAGSAIVNGTASRMGANANNGTAGSSNITIKGLVLNGSATDGNGMLEFDSGSGVNLWSNTYTVSGAEQAVVLFNPQNTNLQGGTFTAPGNNSTNMISVDSTDGITEQNVVLSDFTTVGSDRFVVEWIFTTPAAMRNSHIDRISASGFHGTTGFGCISWVGSTLAGSTGNTGFGNTCTNTAANTELLVGMEVSVANTTFQADTLNYLPFAMSISQIPGGAILDNIILMSTVSTPGGQGSFTQGGTYVPSSEWIGDNTITGAAGTNLVTGCVSGTTGYCTLAHGAYGVQPTLFAPSAVYTP